MISVIFYLFLVGILAYWVESSFQFKTKLLIIKSSPSEELENWLKSFHWGEHHRIQSKVELPQYKFYSEVVEILLNLARRLGGNYQDSLIFLREGLQSDRQFEKRSRETLMGVWLQMLMMMFLTWAFIIGALTLVEVQVGASKLVFILCWQIFGLSLLPFIIKKYREYFFGQIGKLWKMFYVLNSLSKVPLSRSEIFKIAGVSELRTIHQASIMPLVTKFSQICHRALKEGGSYEEEVRHLMSELRFLEKWHGELFEKRLTVIKLGLMGIFFVPSYLVFIYFLLGDLLTSV